ncbi:site-specific DNA-methyltransferase [Agromyces ramosus]|uniref:Adenine-specific DNA-methyltransferase n=1 Tax=Agromyces ramosus TaxID=33879 RepID=A0ABU0R5Y6_9MICO|nr:site-specific DNA-methyltransferase [Agromyces ramosus]MDQ0893496.1 adenine-specific DNA-methyltransferase [Agromyces ramosus]
MAAIDDLIAQVPEPLRGRLVEQVKLLTERKQFGLVFQDHMPEAIEVPGLPPRRDDIVRLRGDDAETNFLVKFLRNGVAGVVEVSGTGEVVGELAEVHTSKLTVVKNFGEPIYAGLKSVGRIQRGGDKPFHAVIQGENYYALETLLYTHQGKADVIYIDPPYNTGSSDWIYNDRYVDGQDAYRHSKWLAFMKRRLEHAKRLLKPTGVIILAIDDTEQARLKLLCDDVFGEQNFLANIVWQGNVKNDARFSGDGIDYMLVFARSREALIEHGATWRELKPDVDKVFDAASRAWRESGGDSTKASRALKKWWSLQPKGSPVLASKHYAHVDDVREGEPYFGSPLMSPNFRKNLVYELAHPQTGRPFKTPVNGWRYAPESMKEMIRDGRIHFGKDETTLPLKKVYLREVSVQTVVPSFREDRRSAGKHLEDIIGSREFPFPKNTDVVARWINIVSGYNPEAVVVDFFVGTGTTTEAVMRMNAQDGGRRQSIVVTNNELASQTARALKKAGHLAGDAEWEAAGIFQKVTRPRIEAVVTGFRRDGSTYSGGFNENVEFFELTFEDENMVALGRRFAAIAPLLWLKAGGTGSVISDVDPAGWALNSDCSYAVLFDAAYSAGFIENVRDHVGTVRHAFIVTNQESAYQQIARELPPQSSSFSSTRLYDDYLRSFQINGKD